MDVGRPIALLAKFDAASRMVASVVGPNSYHTNLPAGTPVRSTRCSMELALALLRRSESGDATLACQIISKVLTLQDTDLASDTCGVWPYFAEERLSQMNPPDRNWADFIGALICEILVRHSDDLDADLISNMRAALGFAADAICRRDISPDYTNIAIMGGGVTCCAGELLDRPEWLAFGVAKLGAVVASAARHGSFPEYNSPTYTYVALEEASRALRLVRDTDARDVASTLAGIAWHLIASHWHPSTQQWAGPHARAYSDLVSDSLRRTLLAAKPRHDSAMPETSRVAPCPPDAADRFGRLPQVPYHFRERCARGDEQHPDRFAITHFEDDFCLGAFSHGHYWDQSRSLIAHVRNANQTSVLRTRMLLNGRDFAGGASVQAVSRTSVLSSACFWSGTGAFHPIFDAPPDGIFDTESLELRVQVSHATSAFKHVDEHLWTIEIGDLFAHVYTPPSSFNGRALVWHAAAEGKVSMLRCTLIDAQDRVAFDPRSADLSLGFAVDLCRDREPRFGMPRMSDQRICWHSDTHLEVPIRRHATTRLW